MSADKPFRFASEKELPELIASFQNMRWNRTGCWRYLRPEYLEKRAPCQDACPAGNDVERFLARAGEGDLEGAWRVILETSPIPGICGRVCFHPCEAACNRANLDRAVAVQAVERFLAEQAAERRLALPAPAADTGLRAAVVGSGPAGLSCAYHLALRGIRAVVFEAADLPGGVLRHGVPAYRLPPEILDREIAAIRALGVEVRTGSRLGNDVDLKALDPFRAVFLATGAHLDRRAGVPGQDLEAVYTGLAFLEAISRGKPPPLGRRTIVVGGGNTAIDSARAAMRLTHEVVLLYRRTKAEMPAHPEEVEEAEREGVEVRLLLAPVGVVREGGHLTVECARMELGPPGLDGRRSVRPSAGRSVFVQCESLILALGEEADLSFLPPSVQAAKGQVVVDAWGRTTDGRIFAGGDLALSRRTVAHAIGSGRRAAEAIHFALGGPEPYDRMPPGPPVPIEDINLAYFSRADRCRVPFRPLHERHGNFEEVNLGVGEEAVRREIGRCFHCGNCTGCDNCLVFCPDMSVRRVASGGYEIDYEYCKGCGVCSEECPRGVVHMEKERLR